MINRPHTPAAVNTVRANRRARPAAASALPPCCTLASPGSAAAREILRRLSRRGRATERTSSTRNMFRLLAGGQRLDVEAAVKRLAADADVGGDLAEIERGLLAD